MRIGFLTAEFLGGLADDDAPAAVALERRGHLVTPVVWTAPIEPTAFDVLVVRSPWDWYRRRAEFRAFLSKLASWPVRVVNAPALLLRFADKTYFRELDRLGIATVPTRFFQPEALGGVPEAMASAGWERCVLKPSFTANAAGALRLDARSVGSAVEQARATPVDSEWMLQPYLDAIETLGERSFVFFDGRFSHAVSKRPAPGDYRVQHDHGGEAARWVPASHLIDAAASVVRRAVPDAVYARVDAVEHHDRLLVMELEVVEPELFFRLDPLAPERFATALERHLGVSSG